MDKKSQFVLKTESVTYNVKSISYYSKHGGWTSDIMAARYYTSIASANKVIDQLLKDLPNSKVEILYVTITIETMDEIAEKEFLQ